MSKGKVTAFIPCRKGSTRLGFDKQLSLFANTTTLLDIKVQQLLEAKKIDNVVLSTDDEKIFEKFNNIDRVSVFERDKKFLELTDANHFADIAVSHINEGNILITHCTVPFFSRYDDVITFFNENNLECVITGRKVGHMVVENNKIVNWDIQNKGVWPQTQKLPNWFEFCTAVEPLMSFDLMNNLRSRLSNKISIFEVNDLEAFDIDYLEQWRIAEEIWKAKQK
jgi:CMP-N-acetylneuraminic acid synthetase